MSFRISIAVVAAGLCGWVSAADGCQFRQEGEVRLAEGGRALARIVIAEKATRPAQFGALDLQWHLKKMTGADFPIVTDAEATSPLTSICVGPSKLTKAQRGDFQPQQCVVSVEPGKIELVGYDSENCSKVEFAEDPKGGFKYKNIPDMYEWQGSMYAVYEFLEKLCGVRWCDMTDLGTVIPERPDLAVACGTRRREPWMLYRGGTIDSGKDTVIWRPKSAERMRHFELGYRNPEWAKHEKPGRLFNLRKRLGGDRRPCNHSFYHYYDLYYRTNARPFVAYRPELFAKGRVGEPPQMCYTNPEFVDLVIRDVRRYFDDPKVPKKWGPNNHALEPMDNSIFCECENCRRLYEPERAAENSQHSTYWFTFVKKVAEEIRKSHPDKTVSTLAYGTHEGLPTNVRLPNNVIVYFCLSAGRFPFQKLCADQFGRMDAWHRAYPGQPLAAWLYEGFPFDAAEAGGYHVVPGYFGHEKAKQFKFFHDRGIRGGIFYCGVSGDMCMYMNCAYLWDPTRDPDEVLNEYFSQFGKAGPHLKEFYDLVEKRWCDPTVRPKEVSGGGVLSWLHICPPEVMKVLEGLVAKAEAAPKSELERKRLELWLQGNWEYMTKGAKKVFDRMALPQLSYGAHRVPDAGGDLAKVDWRAIPAERPQTYFGGGSEKAPSPVTLRLANDATHFYLEFAFGGVKTSDLICSRSIFPFDEMEIYCMNTQERPYRQYASSSDGRIRGASFGEVNWRWNVPSEESCKSPSFFAKVESDVSSPDTWVQRFAFPLDNLASKPLKPGETFYLMPFAVMGQKGGDWRKAVFSGYPNGFWSVITVMPEAALHTVDRSIKVQLAK